MHDAPGPIQGKQFELAGNLRRTPAQNAANLRLSNWLKNPSQDCGLSPLMHVGLPFRFCTA